MSAHAFTLGELTTFHYHTATPSVPEYEGKRVFFIPPSVANFFQRGNDSAFLLP